LNGGHDRGSRLYDEPYVARASSRKAIVLTGSRLRGCGSLPHGQERDTNAQIAARLYLSEARVKGCVSRMLDKLGCVSRAQASLLAHDAPVSSARSPGRRSCRLELGLGTRQAGLRPSPGRSCPPGAAGFTGPPRGGGCCDHVVDAVGDELLRDQRIHGALLG
jgi:hypothetical protein